MGGTIAKSPVAVWCPSRATDHKYVLPHYNAAILTLRALRDSIETWAIAQDAP